MRGGGDLEHRGGYSVPLGIMMHVGDIMSTVGVFSKGGYNLLLIEYLHGPGYPPRY